MKGPWLLRWQDPYVGSRWMQGAVYALLAAVLLWGLLGALEEAKEQAENLTVSLLI